jgi:hypothetical protein
VFSFFPLHFFFLPPPILDYPYTSRKIRGRGAQQMTGARKGEAVDEPSVPLFTPEQLFFLVSLAFLFSTNSGKLAIVDHMCVGKNCALGRLFSFSPRE